MPTLPSSNASPTDIATEICRALRDGGSSAKATGAQRFFKEEIKSHGWNTAALRRAMRQCRREILREQDFDLLVQVADALYTRPVLEEKIAAVFLLENMEAQFRDCDFDLFESWLDHVTNWSDHDALVHCLIGPAVAAGPARARAVFQWAKEKNRWHRRAACVALIRGARKKMFFPEIVRLSNALLADEDDMVQKGLGWLLRETAKFNPKRAVSYLMTIRGRAPRLVLRTACETLPAVTKKRILNRPNRRLQK